MFIKYKPEVDVSFIITTYTRSQAVARIADTMLLHSSIVISDCSDTASPAVFEIKGSKRFGVMRLTFKGHVASSVTTI